MNDDLLNRILNDIQELSHLHINLIFCRKEQNRYISYAPNISEDIYLEIISLIKINLQSKIGCSYVDFNPVRPCSDSEVEYCSLDYVGNFEEVLCSFDNAIPVDTTLNPSDLTFYCLRIRDKSSTFEYCFYRRITKFRRLESKGVKAYFNGNSLNKIDDKIFGIDGYVDLIHVNNSIIIFNHIALERIFKIREQFEHNAIRALRMLGETGRIENFQQFEEDCLADLRYHKTLSRMLDFNPNFNRVLIENFNNIRETIAIFDLDIEISENEQPCIIYSNKSQRMDILRIISDAYCRSLICERNVIHDN